MKQPDSLILADDLRRIGCLAASNELIRLHEANQAMLEALTAIVNSAAANQAAILSPLIDDARAAIAKGEQQ